MNQDELHESIRLLAEHQKQLAIQQAELQKHLANNSAIPLRKDRWDRLGAIAPIISAVIIASGGAWFTAIYNQQQLKLQEIQTIEKFFPHLTGDEKSKRAAILAISSLTDAKLASNVAAIYASEGTVSALEQIARHGESGERKIVNGALARALDNMAENYETEKRYVEATKSYERALALREESFGADSPRILPSLNRLVELYKAHKDYAEAETLLQRAINIQKNTYGADAPQVALEMRRLADLYRTAGQVEKSKVMISKATAIEKNTGGAFRMAERAESVEKPPLEDDEIESTSLNHNLVKSDDAAPVGLDSNLRPAAEKRIAPVSLESTTDRASASVELPTDAIKSTSEIKTNPTESVRTSEQHSPRPSRL